ncbi:MAG: C4-dicarboxylate ABC transporter substrate-binding protein, partial [Betaproteobacteria bacterium]
FPLSDDALRSYRAGRPFLQRYLPFWVANLIDRLLVLGLPILAVAFPLFRVVPPLYRWRVRRRIYRWYGELMFIDHAVRGVAAESERRELSNRISAIERAVDALEPPLAYADQLYALRQHIDYVRERVARAAGSDPGAPRADD